MPVLRGLTITGVRRCQVPRQRPASYRDAVLPGAFIVDPRGTKADPEERVFMIANGARTLQSTTSRFRIQAWADTYFAINGLAWPYTERLTYDAGKRCNGVGSIRLRAPPIAFAWFYYDVLSVGDGERDVPFSAEQRRHVFTHRIDVGGTLSMVWIPEREGNWLFHCHMLDHIGPQLRLRPPMTPAEGTLIPAWTICATA